MSTTAHNNAIHNDRNVYILGAGFSADAGMPLVADFMNTMRDAVAWLNNYAPDRKREIEAIEAVFAFRRNAAAAALRTHIDVENIEELFSLAAAYRQGRHEADESKVALAIAATLDYAAKRNGDGVRKVAADFGETPPSRRPVGWVPSTGHSPNAYLLPFYDLYLGVMTGYFSQSLPQRNTLITFNYDTVAEEALARLGIAYDYGLPGGAVRWVSGQPGGTGDGIPILKLHGSVNWGFNPSAVSHQKMDIFVDYTALQGKNAGHELILAPPTWRKGWAPNHVMAAVWDAAVEALSKATRIIIVGYSLPATDSHFKYLMSAGLRDNISLRKILFVNNASTAAATGNSPAQELEQRLFQVLRPELKERGIVELLFQTAGAFFCGAGNQGNPAAREHLAPDLKSVSNIIVNT